MLDFTFLTEKQCLGDKQLEILKKRGMSAPVTDFSILLCSYVYDDCYCNNSNLLEDRIGLYWTKSNSGVDVYVVDGSVSTYFSYFVSERDIGARPAIRYSSISSAALNKARVDGILEIEYGEYPQKAVPKELQDELENAYNHNLSSIKKTEKTYTTDSRKNGEYEKFKAQIIDEYLFSDGKRYVRVKANARFGKIFTLSNGEKYKDGDYVWVEVMPIKWLVDEKEDIALSERILFAGVQFKYEEDYKGDFSTTDIKWYMDTYFSKEIVRTTALTNESVSTTNERKTRLQKLNPDTTDVMLRRRMTDTEIIKNWIDSGESVLLRGPSGIGKTERIKTLYPNLIYIKLTNNMFPEKVVGSMNLQTGQSIPPDFAKQAIMSLATEEERKLISDNIQNLYELADTIYERSKTSTDKVVIMLDELLNVKPAVQSLVYTLVLNRLVEVGKGLKLPANTVIVATGNQKKYSSVAEDLAEPLEKRFDHILDMEPKVGEWINEYAIPNKIHPSVIGYILSKYTSKGKSESMNDIDYFYEEPEVGERHLDKNGCKGRTNDPRGWVSISNSLYSFERNLMEGKYTGKNVENLLHVSISSKLREEWAREFYDFYNIPTLSIEEVVEKRYTQADLPRDINERFAYITSLLLASESEVGECRNFIKQYCDPEYLQLYDICWIGQDEKRMEKISELEELSTNIEDMFIGEEEDIKKR